MAVKTHEAFGLNSQSQQLLFWDDFLGDQIDDRWTIAGGGTEVVTVIDAQTGGIVRLTTGAVATNSAILYWGNIRSLHVDQCVCVEWKAKLLSTANTNHYLSLNNVFGVDNIMFFHNAGTNWKTACEKNNAPTIVDTGVAPDTDYHLFRIETTATSVAFYIDDVLVETTTTNIPDDVFLEPYMRLDTNTDAAISMDVDYVVIRQGR